MGYREDPPLKPSLGKIFSYFGGKMALYDELNAKSDEELLKIMEKEGGAPAGSIAGGLQTQRRELAKAILNYRSALLTKTQNDTMIKLTRAIYILTFVIAGLTLVNIGLVIINIILVK